MRAMNAMTREAWSLAATRTVARQTASRPSASRSTASSTRATLGASSASGGSKKLKRKNPTDTPASTSQPGPSSGHHEPGLGEAVRHQAKLSLLESDDSDNEEVRSVASEKEEYKDLDDPSSQDTGDSREPKDKGKVGKSSRKRQGEIVAPSKDGQSAEKKRKEANKETDNTGDQIRSLFIFDHVFIFNLKVRVHKK